MRRKKLWNSTRLVLDTAQANERAASEQLDQRKQETADATAAETAAKNNLDAAKASVTEKTAQVQTAEEAMTTAGQTGKMQRQKSPRPVIS